MGLSIPIDLRRDQTNTTLQELLYRQIRDAILSGSLKSGTKLPSSRDMAAELGISRNTVALTFDWLGSEGYIETRPGAGTFVATGLPDAALSVPANGNRSSEAASKTSRGLRAPIAFTGRLPAAFDPDRPKRSYDFWYGRLDRRDFPLAVWRRLLLENLSRAAANFSGYGHPAGHPELRAAIADQLGATRGMAVKADRILITAGAQDGLNILSRLLLAPGAHVVVEDPCYEAAWLLFASYGASFLPVPVDGGGLITENLPDQPKAALAYVTPSHQFPTGGTMPIDRRLALLAWANRAGAYIIEDDYDSDFRYDGPPLTALSGLDRDQRVIYLGSFSKSIGAGLRLGYLVLPPELVEPAIAVKSLASYGQPWLDQIVAADFLQTGAHRQHLRRMLKAYRTRRDTLIFSLRAAFGEDVEIGGDGAGMHLTWILPRYFPSAERVAAAAAAFDVGIYPLATLAHGFSANADRSRAIILGYSSLSTKEITEGVARLAQAVARIADAGGARRQRRKA